MPAKTLRFTRAQAEWSWVRVLVTLPKDAKTVSGGYTTLTFPLDDLAKDAVATVRLEYVQAGKPPPDQNRSAWRPWPLSPAARLIPTP